MSNRELLMPFAVCIAVMLRLWVGGIEGMPRAGSSLIGLGVGIFGMVLWAVAMNKKLSSKKEPVQVQQRQPTGTSPREVQRREAEAYARIISQAPTKHKWLQG